MQTSELTPHGYIMAMPPQAQGTPAWEFFHEMSRGLIHKQNNFLAVIQGFVSLSLMGGEATGTVKENLEQMLEATQGGKVLAERYTTAAGCSRISLQSVNLQEYFRLMAGNISAPCDKLSVPIQINVDPATPAVSADNGKLKDVLVELIANAAEAIVESRQPGVVALDVFPPGRVPESRPGCVDIFVRNSGATIAPDKLKDVFKSFKSTKVSKHIGLGTTISAMLLSQMGGTLGAKVESAATTFWISLPAA